MLAVEEVLSELSREEVNEQGLPPGFRFHPTDEELITFYLGSKVFNGTLCGVDIAEVDLNRCEPWELPDVAKMGEREWYFFSLLDRKYPTGVRTNRATGSGYWKATGKDKEVYGGATGALLGMKKTLVFYKGRAPRGEKTKWVMHEYRLDGDFSCRHTCKEEWVICRILHKTCEKKNGVAPTAATTTRSSFPTLIETLNPFLESETSIQALENDLKSLINPVVFPGFQQSCSASNSSAASMLFKSLISHQECMLKEQTAAILKQCKTETNFSQFELSDATYSWTNKIHPNLSQNPMFFDMDYNDNNNNVLGSAELN